MESHKIGLELNDYQIQMLDYLSQKKNINTNSLIKQAINEYIEKNLSADNGISLSDYQQQWKKTMDDKDREWRAHWNSMNDQQKKQFDDTFKKGLEIGRRDPDFQYTWREYINSGDLPPIETHPDVEWHRLSLLWLSKLTKGTNIEDLIFFGRMKELEKSDNQRKNKESKSN